MSRHPLVTVPPTNFDVAVCKALAHKATPALQGSLQAFTRLADEKFLLGAGLAFWAFAHLSNQNRHVTRGADHILGCVAVGRVLAHTLKRLVGRKRPDRTLVRGAGDGIPHSGRAWDSFPSGHAIQLGAVGVPLARLTPRRFRPLAWTGLFALAVSRIMLLAHYPSDVATGFVGGVLIDRAVTRFQQIALRRRRRM